MSKYNLEETGKILESSLVSLFGFDPFVLISSVTKYLSKTSKGQTSHRVIISCIHIKSLKLSFLSTDYMGFESILLFRICMYTDCDYL